MGFSFVLFLTLLGTAQAGEATARPAPPDQTLSTPAPTTPAPVDPASAQPSWPSSDPSWPPADPPPLAPAPRPAAGQAPPGEDPPPFIPPKDVEYFGGQILLADAGVVALAYGLGVGPLAVVGYPLAAPTVHIVHGDGIGAVQSLLLHVAAPVAGAYIGYELEMRDCRSDMCGLAGLLVGGFLGMVTATAVDAAFLAHVERPRRVADQRPLPTPTLAITPGGLMLGVAGRL
jgi:hypothetical protein